MVTGPAIILHELAHKIAAMSFGFTATFHAAYFWLILGLVLKFMNFGFIFFVPAYVSISGLMTPLQNMIISGAGPFTNLALWLGSEALLRTNLAKKRKMHVVLYLTSKINMFLFIFNMLPILGFDGSKFFSGIFSLF
jgi:Zn-dependent protease